MRGDRFYVALGVAALVLISGALLLITTMLVAIWAAALETPPPSWWRIVGASGATLSLIGLAATTLMRALGDE